MPTNKNAMTRYKVLDDLLSNRYRNYTIEDIVDEINQRLVEMGLDSVGRRCVEKDIAYLKGFHSPFGAEIESYSIDFNNGGKNVKKRCLRYKHPAFSIFKKEMTREEAYLLSQTLNLLGQFDGLPILDELNRLKQELKQVDSRKIVAFTKNPLENSNLFGLLFTAISQKQVIKLTYHTFNSGKKNTILLHPYLLKEYNRRWFLFGAADNDGKLLNFSLEQIDNIEYMSALNYKLCDDKMDEFFDDIIGVTKNENKNVETIQFWVSDVSKNYVITKPLHESQIQYKRGSVKKMREQYPMLEGGEFFSIKCIENYELIRELTSYGAELIVLSPSYLREKIITRTNSILSRYNQLQL